jgi:hypothetical protein
MPGYGSWEDRPWERREGGREEERWRREQDERGRGAYRTWEDERWFEPRRDVREPREEWREPRRAWREPGEWREAGEEWRAGREDWRGTHPGWREPREDWRAARPEQDRPWVERDPDVRGREREGRGLVEWEDRGPLKWLGDRFRQAGGRRARGPKGYTRSDERIHEDVCERIARSGVDASEVEVKVENREVTLTGTVPRREHKWWLESVVDDVFGVEEVHNRIRVSRDEAGERAPDVHH